MGNAVLFQQSTESAANIARNGTLAFNVDVDEAGTVDAITVAQLFDAALFTLSAAGSVYSVGAAAIVPDGCIDIRFVMTVELQALLVAQATATNASNAAVIGPTLDAIS